VSNAREKADGSAKGKVVQETAKKTDETEERERERE
jgi:hypothetical protein